MDHLQEENYDLKDHILGFWTEVERTLEGNKSELTFLRKIHEAIFQVVKGELDEDVFTQEVINFRERLLTLKFSNPITPKQLDFNFLIDMIYWWLDLFLKFLVYRDLSILILALYLEKPLEKLVEATKRGTFSESAKEVQEIIEEYHRLKGRWSYEGNS